MSTPPGFPHTDISWLYGLIAVRASLAEIERVSGVSDDVPKLDAHVRELSGDGFTLLTWTEGEPDLAQWLSRKLGTIAAYLWSEDTSGWFGHSVFESGDEIEAFRCGENYEEELGEFADELAEHFPSREEREDGWDVFFCHGGSDFQFRSTKVNVSEEQLLQGLRFIDERFRALGIPIPRKLGFGEETLTFPQTP